LSIFTRQEIVQQKALQAALNDAFDLLMLNPDFPAAEVQIYDRERELERTTPGENIERLTEARMEYVLKLLDIHGEAYSRLVTDLNSHRALATILDVLNIRIWHHFSGLPIEMIPPPVIPPAKPHAFRSSFDRIGKRARHWLIEGLRRVPPSKAEPIPPLPEPKLPPSEELAKSASSEPVPGGPSDSPKSIIDAFSIQKGWSLDDIAEKAGIDRRQVFKVRNGRPVRSYVRVALAGLLGVEPRQLLPKEKPLS
jgi:hypothetical protein